MFFLQRAKQRATRSSKTAGAAGMALQIKPSRVGTSAAVRFLWHVRQPWHKAELKGKGGGRW